MPDVYRNEIENKDCSRGAKQSLKYGFIFFHVFVCYHPFIPLIFFRFPFIFSNFTASTNTKESCQ